MTTNTELEAARRLVTPLRIAPAPPGDAPVAERAAHLEAVCWPLAAGRKAEGLSLADVGDLLGLTPYGVLGLERGHWRQQDERRLAQHLAVCRVAADDALEIVAASSDRAIWDGVREHWEALEGTLAVPADPPAPARPTIFETGLGPVAVGVDEARPGGDEGAVVLALVAPGGVYVLSAEALVDGGTVDEALARLDAWSDSPEGRAALADATRHT